MFKAVLLKGKITGVNFKNEQTGFCIARVSLSEPRPVNTVLKGNFGFTVEKGKQFSCEAMPKQDPKWGLQFDAIGTVKELMPSDGKGVVIYLQSVISGVGEALATRIVRHLGAENVFRVIRDEPERLHEIEGISKKKAQQIVESWVKNRQIEELTVFLGNFDIKGKKIRSIHTKFGDRAIQVIKENPYKLTEVNGIGFKSADMIAMASGVPPTSMNRVLGAITYIMEDVLDGNGETAISEMKLAKDTIKLLGLKGQDQAVVFEGIEQQIDQGRLISRDLPGYGTCLSTPKVVALERAVANEFKRILDGAPEPNEDMAEVAAAMASELGDEDQIKAVSGVFRSPITVITGRPGCGKTTVTKYIVSAAVMNGFGENDIVCCTPTGKAAKRMSEATGRCSTTLHYRLGFKGGHFVHNATNPLHGRLFIIDESTMVDLAMAKAFLSAIPSGARLLLIGDNDQISSVGAGATLRDMINSSCFPVFRLHTPHRTAADSDIIINAHKICDGEVKGVSLEGDRDFCFHRIEGLPEGEGADEDCVVALVRQRYVELSKQFGAENVQVLAARNGTSCGTVELNKAIRALANPERPENPTLNVDALSFRRRDRVMQCTNDMALGVMNGEVGTVVSIDFVEKSITVDFGDATPKEIPRDKLQNLTHSHATSIHKSQGSEYAAVIVVCVGSHAFLMNRNLLYTGVTRGKKHVDIVGEPKYVRMAISKAGNERVTGLENEIRELLKPKPTTTIKKNLFR